MKNYQLGGIENFRWKISADDESEMKEERSKLTNENQKTLWIEIIKI